MDNFYRLNNTAETEKQAADDKENEKLAYLESDEYLATGKYARQRADFLKKNKPVLAGDLVRAGEWEHYLADVERRAEEILHRTIKRMAQEDGLTEEKKVTDPFEWIGLMNMYKLQAEEIINHEIIYR